MRAEEHSSSSPAPTLTGTGSHVVGRGLWCNAPEGCDTILPFLQANQPSWGGPGAQACQPQVPSPSPPLPPRVCSYTASEGPQCVCNRCTWTSACGGVPVDLSEALRYLPWSLGVLVCR